MIRALVPALLGIVAAPVAAEPMCAPTATVPGFAPGQAPLGDRPLVGHTVSLALRPIDNVTLPVPSGRPALVGTYGGSYPLQITLAGTYRLLLSGHAWIDLVRDGAALVSTEHEHGAPCSGVAKIVAFKLEPGRYDVQLSEVETRNLTIKVAREQMIPVKQ